MTDEEIMVAEQPLTPEEAFEVEDYRYGDLYIKCSCGNDSLEMAGIEGLQVIMPATNKDMIDLHCPTCGHQLKLYFRKAADIDNLLQKREAMVAEIEKIKEQLKEIETKEAELTSVESNEEESTEREG